MSGAVKLPDIIERTIEAVFERRKQNVRHGEALFGQRGDSPIEWAMSIALEHTESVGLGSNELTLPGADWEAYFRNPQFDGLVTIPQAKVGNYRADFMIVTGGQGVTVALAIECDGHDFHERTKEQARHDRSRDRLFIEQGIIVLRFTGSEIYADANKCAEQALLTARTLWFDRFALRNVMPE